MEKSKKTESHRDFTAKQISKDLDKIPYPVKAEVLIGQEVWAIKNQAMLELINKELPKINDLKNKHHEETQKQIKEITESQNKKLEKS